MSQTDSDQSTFSIAPKMSAEGGFEEISGAAPLRVSGFISGMLGVASAICILGMPLVVIPAAGILLGIYALRRYDGAKPVGTMAARIGILLSIGFGAFGLGAHVMKRNTLATQGEAFAREFIKLAAQGEDLYCMELSKDYANRFLPTMPLEEHYHDGNTGAMEQLQTYRDKGVVSLLKRLGPDVEWELDRAINVQYKYGAERVDIHFVNDPYAKKPSVIRVTLDAKYRASTDQFEWHVSNFMVDRDRIVADSIL